jgi:hypothetical protein
MEKFWKKNENFNFENLNRFKPLLILPLIIWFIYMVSDSSNLSLQNKKRLEMNIHDEYKDKVIEKGRDKNNRNTPYLIREQTNLYHEDSIVWSKIDVGDTLIKLKNSSLLKIVKKDTIIIVDYRDVYKYWDSIYKNEKSLF